ncbi:hypothetical protein [Winogradskyella sp.]|uniref:hypothetical protein n=1 Tax=Winogradskyella sp. TaxID=1883156 RepID=UPI0026346D75|nr:hypothetical protein [Winogradskyella sp.]
MKRLTIVFCTFLFSINLTISQDHQKFVNYPKNIDDALSIEEKAMIIEVYGEDAAEKYIFSIPQRLKDTKHILRNRFEIVELKNKDLSKLKKLSEIPIFDVYMDIKRDQTIDLENFNPLKYQFNFYGKLSQYVRIDNTSYVIIIKSQFE